MIPNGVKAKWAAGETVVNGWCSIGNPFVAEIMASAGFDALTIDLQHGFLDYNDARAMLQAMRASGVTPMVRVPWNDPAAIMKSLDAGAYGVICPMVNSRAEAEHLVDCLRYPPRGNRSFGPTRALFSTGGGYPAEANDQMIALAMIETGKAVKNVEEIVSTPGLDGIYIGPSDLTLGYTNGRLPSGLDREEDEMIEVIQRVLAAAHAAGIKAGIHCGTPDYGARAAGWGFDLVTIAADVGSLSGAVRGAVGKTRDLLNQEKTGEGVASLY